MPISLVRDGRVDDLHFRRWWELDDRDGGRYAWHFLVGDECWGFVTPSTAWKGKWDAWSYNRKCPPALRRCGGFATRLDAGRFIVKTYGYWENN